MAYIEEKMYESDIDIKGTLKRLYGLGAKKLNQSSIKVVSKIISFL